MDRKAGRAPLLLTRRVCSVRNKCVETRSPPAPTQLNSTHMNISHLRPAPPAPPQAPPATAHTFSRETTAQSNNKKTLGMTPRRSVLLTYQILNDLLSLGILYTHLGEALGVQSPQQPHIQGRGAKIQRCTPSGPDDWHRVAGKRALALGGARSQGHNTGLRGLVLRSGFPLAAERPLYSELVIQDYSPRVSPRFGFPLAAGRPLYSELELGANP